MPLPKNQIDCLVSLSSGAYDKALVILQHLEPVLNVGCAVLETAGSFKPCMEHKRGASDFGNQFLFAVAFPAKVRCSIQAVQALHVPCAVSQLMKGCAVILCGFTKLVHQRKNHGICRWLIISLIAFLISFRIFPLSQASIRDSLLSAYSQQ